MTLPITTAIDLFPRLCGRRQFA